MASKHYSIQQDQLEMITIDQLVPANHLVRKMEAVINFSIIYDLEKDMYSEKVNIVLILSKYPVFLHES
ncbi:hypothetical protein [Peribacillus simplex]|uniref:hypothetical protein n=1 Tax=Peribacillus simplex TaxID=1478 RepID=UPI00399A6DAD